jgi:hypothetical protein
VETSYLLTIATSDGADEAPGAKKQAISTASLATPEGLALVIGTLQFDLSEEISNFFRFGHIATAVESRYGSNIIGDEIDYQIQYRFDTKSVVQIDYGYLFVRDFYLNPKDAQLFAGKYRVEF